MGQNTTTDVSDNNLIVTGIPQGAKIGQMGGTGYSFGDHGDIQFGISMTNQAFDPLETYFPENGILEGVNYHITQYAKQYSGLPLCSLIQNSNTITNADVRKAFDKLTEYYDSGNVPENVEMERWTGLMNNLGKDSLDFAKQLQDTYPDSRIVSAFFDQKYQEAYWLAMNNHYQNVQNSNQYYQTSKADTNIFRRMYNWLF